MKTAARSRAVKSLIVCFYCNETFRSLSSLNQHNCSAEEKMLDWESSHEDFSDINDVDLSQVDWEQNETLGNANNCDSVISDSVSEKPSDIRQELTEADLIPNHVSENLLPQTKTNEQISESKSNAAEQEIADLASVAPEKQLLEGNLDLIREVTESSSAGLEKQLLEGDLDIIKEFLESSSEAHEKQLLEGNLGTVREENTESVTEKPSQIKQGITEVESTTNVSENLLSQPKTENKPILSEKKSIAAEQKIADLPSDAPEKQLVEGNLDTLRDIIESFSAALEKQSLEGNLNVVREENTESSSEKRLSEGSSKVKEVIDLASDALTKPLPIPKSDLEQRNTEVETNADDLDRASPDLVSKVLQYYEKQSMHDIPDSCYKSPTEIEFQASHLPLPAMESSSPTHKSAQMECSTAANEVLSSETKCDKGEDIIQKESDVLKENEKSLKFYNSNNFSRMSSEIDTPDMLSRSSSEMDLDSVGYADDQAESDDSDVCSAVNISEEKSHTLKHDQIQIELHTSKTSGKTLTDEIFDIKVYGSVVLKPCYVKVKDIFKTLSNSELSPKKIFSMEKKYHVCDKCCKFFRHKSDLNIHYLTHSTDKPYKCNKCGKSYVKQNNLFTHHLIHTTKKQYACPICKRLFLTKYGLRRHKYAHTAKKPFPCDKCDKSYCTNASLAEHYVTHSEERPFKCEICNASFKNKRYLKKHYYRFPHRDISCEFCYKPFKKLHHLEEHYNIHLNNKPHECKICGKTFYLLLTLNQHYHIVHNEEKNLIFKKENLVHKKEKSDEIHNCELCDKTFKHLHNLEEHYNKHLNKRPHVCKICGKSFCLLLTLNNHYFKVHKIEKDCEFEKSLKTPIVCKIGKDPIIQKIEKSQIVNNSEKAAVQKMKENDYKSGETLRHVSRRKSQNPKKYPY